ncbi:MAG: branched-chain amino acid ABC transporter permease [Roseiflexaceae bacterium]
MPDQHMVEDRVIGTPALALRQAAGAGMLRRWIGPVLAILGLLGLSALPAFMSPYQLRTYTTLLLLALMAQGWNLIGGYTGYAAFGNVAFFGIGAYTTGLLMISPWHVPFFVALAAGALLAALVAALVGLPVLRLRGHYFAIATLGVAEALRQVADAWDSLTNGSTGIDLPLNPNASFFYYTALVLVALGLLISWLLLRSKIGYGWLAIREDQDAARMLGINTTRFKVLAFALSAAFAALAGGVTAYQNIHVTPTDFFRIDYTLQMIIACVIGGAGTLLGPLIGAAVYQLLSTYLWGQFIELHPTFLGLIIIFFVVFLPRGLMQLAPRTIAVITGRRPFRWRNLFANIRANRVQ